jgi:hypothetical protein
MQLAAAVHSSIKLELIVKRAAGLYIDLTLQGCILTRCCRAEYISDARGFYTYLTMQSCMYVYLPDARVAT